MAEGLGSDGSEFELGFAFEAVEGGVVEPRGEIAVFHAFGAEDHFVLAVEVAGVFEVGFEEVPDFGGELGAEVVWDFLPCVFGAAHPFFDAEAVD